MHLQIDMGDTDAHDVKVIMAYLARCHDRTYGSSIANWQFERRVDSFVDRGDRGSRIDLCFNPDSCRYGELVSNQALATRLTRSDQQIDDGSFRMEWQCFVRHGLRFRGMNGIGLGSSMRLSRNGSFK